MRQGRLTIVATALLAGWPQAFAATVDPPLPGQATADRIMKGSAAPADRSQSDRDAGARASSAGTAAGAAVSSGRAVERAARGPGNSRDTPMPASGQDTTVMQPVEPGVADRGALAASLREMPITLRMPGAFENVYPVPGRPGLFFRAQGALYMVFDEATYRFYKGTRYVTIPPGAVFYVGRPNWSAIPEPWFRGADAGDTDPVAGPRSGTSGSDPLQTYIDTEVDPVGQSPEQLRSDVRVPVRRAEVGGQLGRVPGHSVGYGASSASAAPADPAQAALAVRTVEERERDAAAPRAPDAAALAGVLPAGVSRDLVFIDSDGEVRPRIVGDTAYRRERIAALMRSAASRTRGSSAPRSQP